MTRTDAVSTFLAENPQAEVEAVRRTPLGRLATAEDVAEAATWLLSDRSAYVAGVTLPVDGGMVAVRT